MSGLSGLGADDELADTEAFGDLKRFFGGADDFSDTFIHGIYSPAGFFYCALLGNNYMQSWREFFAVQVVCFVCFRDRTGIWGFDGWASAVLWGGLLAGMTLKPWVDRKSVV